MVLAGDHAGKHRDKVVGDPLGDLGRQDLAQRGDVAGAGHGGQSPMLS
jgi:hypothetical protein